MTDVKMPQMGESIVEGTIAVWLVDAGQFIKADEPLVTISTDKADVDMPSPASGVLSEIIAKQGETVKVGAVIGRIDETAKEAPPAPEPTAKEGPPKPPVEPPLAVEGVSAAEAMNPPGPEELVQPPPEIKREPEPPVEKAVPAPVAPDMSAFYSPAVMRLALELGVDLRAVEGTGEGGRVTKKDVEQAAKQPPVLALESNAPSYPPLKIRGGGEARGVMTEGPTEGLSSYRPPVYEIEEGDNVQPFTRLRRLIADHMVYSKRTSAHVTTFCEADFDIIVGIRNRIKDKIKSEVGISLTFMPFVMLALIRALKDYPLMNSVVQGDSILTKKNINLGVAVDSERGLVVPIIKNAGGMGLVELAKAVSDLSTRVRDRKVMPEELAGGTFTITNPGRHGNLFGTPIISQPQVGILRMGELIKRAVVVEVDGEDAIAIRPMMHLSLSYDHRVVDGLTANEFLHRIREHLEGGDFGV